MEMDTSKEDGSKMAVRKMKRNDKVWKKKVKADNSDWECILCWDDLSI